MVYWKVSCAVWNINSIISIDRSTPQACSMVFSLNYSILCLTCRTRTILNVWNLYFAFRFDFLSFFYFRHKCFPSPWVLSSLISSWLSWPPVKAIRTPLLSYRQFIAVSPETENIGSSSTFSIFVIVNFWIEPPSVTISRSLKQQER